ncbi:F-box/LRR-repeat protein 2 [Anabrus simplex]|uniref:F-box/LRR-repeat protein 2 n=1 Tax=Anabrus simplex TaxID=316456 RepID=UPI0034DDB437
MNVRPEMFPAEILLKIFSYCSHDDLVRRIPFVCRWWQEVWKHRTLWRCNVYRPNFDRRRVKNILKLSPQLHAIDLSTCNLNVSVVETMVQCCQDIQQLCIPIYTFLDYVRSKDTPIFSNIKVLILTQEERSGNALKYLADNLPSGITLKYLADNLPNLEHLELLSHYCSKADLTYFLERKKHKLRTLALRCLTTDGYCVIPLLLVCTNLNTLSLRNFCDKVSDGHLEGGLQLRNISSLALLYFGSLPEFSYFPNVVELQLHYYTVAHGDSFRSFAINFPLLRKLSFDRSPSLDDSSLGNLHYFQKLTSVSIVSNRITDRGMQQLESVPGLTYLDLYNCSKLTVECLKLICNFRNLQVLKFDLWYLRKTRIDLKVSDIKNRGLHLMFYRCRDVTKFDYLREQNIRVTILDDKRKALGCSKLL